jgi:GDPmannose 4,6-dehydratase
VKEFLELTFEYAGLNWKSHVEIDPRYYRPAEVDMLIGDYGKAKKKLGWKPKTRFADLARLMVDADIELLRKHQKGEIRVSS